MQKRLWKSWKKFFDNGVYQCLETKQHSSRNYKLQIVKYPALITQTNSSHYPPPTKLHPYLHTNLERNFNLHHHIFELKLAIRRYLWPSWIVRLAQFLNLTNQEAISHNQGWWYAGKNILHQGIIENFSAKIVVNRNCLLEVVLTRKNRFQSVQLIWLYPTICSVS